MSEPKCVGIHVNAFPVPSEAFVVEQARSLTQFTPRFLVRRQMRDTREFDCRAIESSSGGKWRRLAFALAPGAWAWGGADEIGTLDLIHAHFGPNGVYALPIAKRLRVPLVTTFHGFDATVNARSLWREGGIFGMRYLAGLPRLKREGRVFIAVSKFIQSRLLAMGFPESRIRQHYIGVDPERFSPCPPGERTLDVVCVARLIEAKGISVLIRAFAQVSRRYPEANVQLIGEGSDRPRFEQIAQECGVAERVHFVGTLPHTEVAMRVRRCAVSALVSKTGVNGWQEAFGLASIEAAAAGLPAVVSRHGGLPETVEEGVTGLVVEEGSVDGLARALDTLLGNASLRSRMGQAGRARVREGFDLRMQTLALERIYREALT